VSFFFHRGGGLSESPVLSLKDRHCLLAPLCQGFPGIPALGQFNHPFLERDVFVSTRQRFGFPLVKGH
jgi:hypothetical protein